MKIHDVGVKFLESVKIHVEGVKIHVVCVNVGVKIYVRGVKVDLEHVRFLESFIFLES